MGVPVPVGRSGRPRVPRTVEEATACWRARGYEPGPEQWKQMSAALFRRRWSYCFFGLAAFNLAMVVAMVWVWPVASPMWVLFVIGGVLSAALGLGERWVYGRFLRGCDDSSLLHRIDPREH